MKQYILSLFLLLAVLPCMNAQSHSPHASDPVSIAGILIDEISEQRMAETCLYYHLSEGNEENGYKAYTDTKGNKILFRLSGDNATGLNKEIKVVSPSSPKAIGKSLIAMGFRKSNDGYERGNRFSSAYVLATISSKNPTILLIRKIRK